MAQWLERIIIVLYLFENSFNVGRAERHNRGRDMAIECRRCGGPTMLETVIKLRRGVLGLSETRSQSAYCATCKLSVPMENPAAMRPSIAISGRPRPSLSGFLPVWLRLAPARSGGVKWV
jgi:hypothetical protein